MYALIMQSQSFVSAVTLAREFRMANPALGSSHQRIAEEVLFVQIEEVAKQLANNPGLTIASPEIKKHLDWLQEEIEDRRQDKQDKVFRKPGAEQAFNTAHQVIREVITAMTADELKGVWIRLHGLLQEIMNAPRTKERGS
jgi:hypothetical protein